MRTRRFTHSFSCPEFQSIFKTNYVKYKEGDYYRPLELQSIHYMKGDSENHASHGFLQGQCAPFLEVRPLKDFPKKYGTNFRYAMTISIAGSFAMMGLVFCAFDKQTKLQDEKMIQYAAQSNQVLSSLFPSTVRDRMFQSPEEKLKDEDAGGFAAPTDGNSTIGGSSADPENAIADLYPETTILFADIAGKCTSRFIRGRKDDALKIFYRHRFHCMELYARAKTSVHFVRNNFQGFRRVSLDAELADCFCAKVVI